jgi:hypothetical protein
MLPWYSDIENGHSKKWRGRTNILKLKFRNLWRGKNQNFLMTTKRLLPGLFVSANVVNDENI